MRWYELSPDRLVLEVARMEATGHPFTLKLSGGTMYWQGCVSAAPPNIQAEPLQIAIKYPDWFPASSPEVEIISPAIDEKLVGHEWHRLYNGDICYIRDDHWNIATTVDEVVAKVQEWYFNFLAKKHGLINVMPDFCRHESNED